MYDPRIGFAVVYRWRIRDGMEEQFQQAWESVTKSLKVERGALGSRLHRAEDGSWVAYAQWSDRGHWERSRELGPVDADAAAMMGDAIEESAEPITLVPILDLLDQEVPE